MKVDFWFSPSAISTRIPLFTQHGESFAGQVSISAILVNFSEIYSYEICITTQLIRETMETI